MGEHIYIPHELLFHEISDHFSDDPVFPEMLMVRSHAGTKNHKNFQKTKLQIHTFILQPDLTKSVHY